MAHLLYLVRFRYRIPQLQVKKLGNSWVGEDVVTALDALGETQPRKETPKVREANVPIRCATKYPQ